MEKYNLNNNDFELINKLTKNTNNINILYNELYKREMAGKKDSTEYKILLNEIKYLLKEEDKLYKEADLNVNKAIAWTSYISNITRITKEDDIETITNQNYNGRTIKRMLNKLTTYFMSDHNYISNMISDELKDIFEELDNKEELLKECTILSIQMQKTFEKDLLYTFLEILKEFINDNKLRIYKPNLIEAIYNISFINKDIESFMIINNFNIPDTLYINSQIVADILNVEDELYNELKNNYFIRIISTQINNLLNIKDTEYSDDIKASSSILKQCLLRAGLSFINTTNIENIKHKFYEFTKSPNYLNNYHDNTLSYEIIINCFKNINKDKNKQHILSLKP